MAVLGRRRTVLAMEQGVVLAPLPPGRAEEEGEERGKRERDDESGGHQPQGERGCCTRGASAGSEHDSGENEQATNEHGTLYATGTPSFAPLDALRDVRWNVVPLVIGAVVRVLVCMPGRIVVCAHWRTSLRGVNAPGTQDVGCRVTRRRG